MTKKMLSCSSIPLVVIILALVLDMNRGTDGDATVAYLTRAFAMGDSDDFGGGSISNMDKQQPQDARSANVQSLEQDERGVDDRDLSTSSATKAAKGGGNNKPVKVIKTANGPYYTCALILSNTALKLQQLKCWGNNQFGQLGYGDVNNRGINIQPNDEYGSYSSSKSPIKQGKSKTKSRYDNSKNNDDSDALLSSDEHEVDAMTMEDLDATTAQEANKYRYNDEYGLGTPIYYEHGSQLPYVDFGSAGSVYDFVVSPHWTFSACAIFDIGRRMKCFGKNSFGQLGYGDTNPRGDGRNDNIGMMGDYLPFVDVGKGLTINMISIGGGFTCIIVEQTRGVKCFGKNNLGQLGIEKPGNFGDEPNEMGDNLPFVNLGTKVRVVTIGAGSSHSCAVIEGNLQLKCWGFNRFGQLGYDDVYPRGGVSGSGPNAAGYDYETTIHLGMGDELPFVNLGKGLQVQRIQCGTAFTCALLTNGMMKCFGLNFRGQLGLGDTRNRGKGKKDDEYEYKANEYKDNGSPTEAPYSDMGENLPFVILTGKAGSTVTSNYKVSTYCIGSLHTCAVMTPQSSVKCWGGVRFYYDYEEITTGELGYGDDGFKGLSEKTIGDYLPFVDLGKGNKVKSISCGYDQTCALFTNDRIKCWGNNWFYPLGIGGGNIGDNKGEMGKYLPFVELGSPMTSANTKKPSPRPTTKFPTRNPKTMSPTATPVRPSPLPTRKKTG